MTHREVLCKLYHDHAARLLDLPLLNDGRDKR